MSLGRPIRAPIARPLGEAFSRGGLPWDVHGGGGPFILNLGAGGTFTRSTEGFYYLRAPTDGSLPFGGWADVNVRRIEDRGDGLGSMLLMEGSRTNYLLQSRDLANGAWSLGAATLTSNQNGGVDGATLADRVNGTSVQYGPYQLTRGQVAYSTASVWARAVSGTVSHQLWMLQGAGGAAAKALSIGTTYARNAASGNCTPGQAGYEPVECRDETAYGGQVATAQDVYVDLCQLETGYFPSSPIRTTTAAVTRGADVLSYAVGQYPASFLDRGFRITVAPDMSSAEVIASGANYVLVSQNALNYLLISPTATVDFFGQSGRIVQSGALSWSRGQVLTIEASPNGRLVVSGATSGNGTFTAAGRVWPSATITIGSLAGGTSFFGRIGTSIVAL